MTVRHNKCAGCGITAPEMHRRGSVWMCRACFPVAIAIRDKKAPGKRRRTLSSVCAQIWKEKNQPVGMSFRNIPLKLMDSLKREAHERMMTLNDLAIEKLSR